MSHTVALELAVQDVAGARVAAAVGAQRIELCAALSATGGLTPSVGLVEAVALALAGTGTQLHVLVRPRAGGFVYDADEVAVQVRDVRAVLEAGADGVVAGALTASGGLDEAALASLVAAADGADVTFHRAFDMIEDRVATVDALARAGVRRVLTSGGGATVADGLDELTRLVPVARDRRVQLMAGGGVRPSDIAALVAAGVDAVHLSAKRAVAQTGGPGGGSGGYDVTDAGLATAAADALRAAADGSVAAS